VIVPPQCLPDDAKVPAGIDYSSVGSYVALAAVKAAAYTAYAGILNRRHDGQHAALVVGGVRTAIGMAIGGAYFWSILELTGKPPPEALGFWTYWASLLPLRVAEWWILLRLFYPSASLGRRKLAPISWGTGVSYLADVPATLGWLVTGGLSIC
jgi:hypothetical protein